MKEGAQVTSPPPKVDVTIEAEKPVGASEVDATPANSGKAAEQNSDETSAPPQIKKTAPAILTTDEVANALFNIAPKVTMFRQQTGLLPNQIDIVEEKGAWQLKGDGATAAQNFLDIANLKLEELVKGDPRVRVNLIKRANIGITSDFAKFWSQTIGKREKLQLECEFSHYGSGEKKGAPHLVFWISDGTNKLYPKQRSQGVRWFVSFYLQLKASEKASASQVFLLDEPGANLHSKAQADVLKLINQLSRTIPIVYSTHSPHMIEYEKLYRVLAVQRNGEEGDSPTTVIHAHKLAGASRDTLSPVLTAMGVDLASQQVVQKKNNVILEEISGFYYLSAFWRLLAEQREAHFIAASGVNNVEGLANMFLGWGLDFIVVVDDDQQGRSVYNSMKKNMFGDREESAMENLLKISGCKGIEDIFSKSDFAKLVLGTPDQVLEIDNSEYVKGPNISKPVLAYQFWIRVSKQEFKFEEFDDDTRKNVTALVTSITTKLGAKAQAA